MLSLNLKLTANDDVNVLWQLLLLNYWLVSIVSLVERVVADADSLCHGHQVQVGNIAQVIGSLTILKPLESFQLLQQLYRIKSDEAGVMDGKGHIVILLSVVNKCWLIREALPQALFLIVVKPFEVLKY